MSDEYCEDGWVYIPHRQLMELQSMKNLMMLRFAEKIINIGEKGSENKGTTEKDTTI